MDAVPRTPRRAGILMRFYYLWCEIFTYAGHVCAALFLFAMAAGAMAGFWAAWVFSGFIFLFLISLVPSLFMTARKTKIEGSNILVTPVTEGQTARVSVRYRAVSPVDCVSLSCFRLDTSLACTESPSACALAAGAEGELQCEIKTKTRGAYRIPKVALVVPEIKGMLRYPVNCGESELLVYPKAVQLHSFAFLTMGKGGQAFAPLLMPRFARGLDFAGVREYREGDSLRDLHHRAFARYGRPFTKEFESERGAGAIFVLDVQARNLRELSLREPLIRLAAGIGLWFLERGILGRFFVGDDEIPLLPENATSMFLESLARIPRADIRDAKNLQEHPWSPAARPMGPVLRLGLFPSTSPLVHKQVVVSASAYDAPEDVLCVPAGNLDAGEVSL